MSLSFPASLDEWEAYINTLSGFDLQSKALAANSLTFVRSIESEGGYKPADITEILRMFAVRLEEQGMHPPGRSAGGYISYANLLHPVERTLGVRSEPSSE